jgi:hypothetical protein
MAPRTKPVADPAVADTPIDPPTPPAAKVAARYVGTEPVMAPINGVPTIITNGDRIMVSPEQLEQNPIFEAWED